MQQKLSNPSLKAGEGSMSHEVNTFACQLMDQTVDSMTSSRFFFCVVTWVVESTISTIRFTPLMQSKITTTTTQLVASVSR